MREVVDTVRQRTVHLRSTMLPTTSPPSAAAAASGAGCSESDNPRC